MNTFRGPRRVAGLFAGTLAAVGLWIAAGATLAASPLTVITEDYPPLNFIEDGELKGPSVEIAKLIMDRLGMAADIKVYPWARGYNHLQNRKDTVLFSTARTTAREKMFKWVGPIAEKRIGFFAKRDRGIKLGRLADAKAYLIGVQRGGVTMQYLDQHGMRNYDAASNSIANLRKLMAGNNDLWLSSNSTVAGTCKRLNIDTAALEMVLEVEKTAIYIAFHKATPDAVIDAWQTAYDQAVAEGTVDGIFRKYGLTSMRPSFRR